ncbi:MAG: tetratricopeptide repeat protein [Kiritimatiellaeota bacterium]|nr:tetratricopeptide repeat protein [Kiritimatiellota bacterium]
MQTNNTQVRNAEFPRIGKGGHWFFQGLEKTARFVSKVWKSVGAWKIPVACTLLCWCAPSRCAADMFDQPEYNRVEAEPTERFYTTPTEEMAALRRREADITASARSDLIAVFADFKAARWNEVIPKMEALIETDPTIMPAWDLLGSAYWRAGRRDDALKLWNRLRTIRPDYPPVYTWLGRAYMLANDLANARACFSKGLQLQHPLHDEDLNYGRVLRWSGALEEAIALLRPLAQAKPDRTDIVRELAAALTSNRDYQEALPLWKQLCTETPTNLLFKAKEAVVLLHTEHPAEALALAREVLQEDAAQLDALGVLADHAQYFSSTQEDALPVLLQMAALTTKPQKQRQLSLRYVNLSVRLNEADPEHFPLERTAGLLASLLEKDPLDTDSRLALGETLAINRNYAAAREQLQWVLDHTSPNNVRALRKLFEIAIVEEKPREAEDMLQRLIHFNPRDPYRHFFLARYHLSQLHYAKALEEVDQLEAEGARGAIAVLLYHGLSTSDNGEILPVSRLTEHIRALKAAGFRFFSANELPRRLAENARLADNTRNNPAEREVCITFDDARRDSMRIGTPVGVAEKVRFSMHIPVGYTENNHPFICTWDMLREYQKAGCWVFGGHSWSAHDRVAIDGQHRVAAALPNHIWNEALGRVETNAEYERRLDHEYGDCQRLIAKELGRGSACNFFAYPFGDIGQLTRCNDTQAPQKNLLHGSQAYACGFIQTLFGYAVATDYPMLYQRYEPSRYQTGAEVVQRVLENHPVTMARVMRATIYALQNKRHAMLENVALLMRDGYPEISLHYLHTNLEYHLNRKIVLPKVEEAPAPGTGAPFPLLTTPDMSGISAQDPDAVPSSMPETQPIPAPQPTLPFPLTPIIAPEKTPVLPEVEPLLVPTNTLPRRKAPAIIGTPERSGLRDLRNPLR